MAITTVREQSDALVVQITSLVEGYMVWVGLVDEDDVIGNLCKDWAVAMPASEVAVLDTYGFLQSQNGTATSLCRSGGSDAALAMAQRLGGAQEMQIDYRWLIRDSYSIQKADIRVHRCTKWTISIEGRAEDCWGVEADYRVIIIVYNNNYSCTLQCRRANWHT